MSINTIGVPINTIGVPINTIGVPIKTMLVPTVLVAVGVIGERGGVGAGWEVDGLRVRKCGVVFWNEGDGLGG